MAIPRLVHDKKRGIILTASGAYFVTLDEDDALRVVAAWNRFTEVTVADIDASVVTFPVALKILPKKKKRSRKK